MKKVILMIVLIFVAIIMGFGLSKLYLKNSNKEKFNTFIEVLPTENKESSSEENKNLEEKNDDTDKNKLPETSDSDNKENIVSSSDKSNNREKQKSNTDSQKSQEQKKESSSISEASESKTKKEENKAPQTENVEENKSSNNEIPKENKESKQENEVDDEYLRLMQRLFKTNSECLQKGIELGFEDLEIINTYCQSYGYKGKIIGYELYLVYQNETKLYR